MREQEPQFERGRDPEATVIRPLFDEDATEVARPVVPLDDRAVTAGVGAYVETGTAPPVYTRAWKRRNQWTAILVLAALFAGTAVGITGLYLYQRSRTSAETAAERAAPAEEAPAASEAPQTATATRPTIPNETEGAPATAPPPVTVEAPTAADTEVAAGGGAGSEKSNVKVSDGEGASRETARATARREQPEEEEPSVAPAKRGRKGGDDDEPRATRPRVYDTQEAAPSGSAAERRAAREDERLRRMRRERRRGRGEAYMVDSIRGIFEGGRQSPPR
jgi:hypothetical protein